MERDIDIDLEYVKDPILVIQPLNTKAHEPINIHPNFPQHPSLLYVCAGMGSGKTALIQYLLVVAYCQFFNKIFYFSPTLHQESWEKIKKDPDRVYEHYSDENFNKVLAEIKEDKDERCLIVIDDCTATNIFRRENALSKFIFNHRQYPTQETGTSVWIISHQYKTVPKNVRSVVKDLIIFKLRSGVELDEIATDVRGLIPKKEFIHLYSLCTEKQYSFMYIAKEQRDEESDGKMNDIRIRKNFNTIFKISYVD